MWQMMYHTLILLLLSVWKVQLLAKNRGDTLKQVQANWVSSSCDVLIMFNLRLGIIYQITILMPVLVM